MLRMRNETLASHKPPAVIRIIQFLFQIAILAAAINTLFYEDDHGVWKAYVRSTINNEAEANAK